jgi:signal transduction histidine kinase
MVLENLGFGPAVRKYVREFGEQMGLKITVRGEGEKGLLSPSLEPVFLRLVQEGRNNVAKYARPRAAN